MLQDWSLEVFWGSEGSLWVVSQRQLLCSKSGPWRYSGAPKAAFGWPGTLPGIWSDSVILVSIFRENVAKPLCVLHGSGAGVVHESGSSGNGPQLAVAVRTLGYSRLRPG